MIVGAALMVYSGFRFVLKATYLGPPVAAITLGRPRADALLTLPVEPSCAAALANLL